MSDEIDVLESDDDLDNLPCYGHVPQAKPIVVKGIGRLTVFGLSSRFDPEFPSALTGKLAPEELEETMQRINSVLQRSVHTHVRWLLCGLLFCCCTIGCSLWPVVCLSKRTISALEKTLDYENQQLYNKLEYVLLLETLPKVPLLIPD
ncbi:golgin subfamily A member 7/ERF4 family domain-containing protein [Ditylenchus destructor]|uniref:Golgin subfamily A member 7/ERF4 family domain-containing protein n=1 Tax=Ditylenchus destructor TaxID=166010 RepID=A0AAD4NC00_9BILA|nr:golgin subfamily A member 7/ERF4 family domain-containing protein [Ditylenchus destructor]